jgi:hypothetical protein
VMAVAEGRGKVIVDATFTEEQLEWMKSLMMEILFIKELFWSRWTWANQ